MLVMLKPCWASQSLCTKTPMIKCGATRNWSTNMASLRTQDRASPRRSSSALETRISLVLALAAQSSSLSRRILGNLVAEAGKYAFPRRSETRNMEEALMSVPDLETIKFKVLKHTDSYEIREVEPYFIAETTMPGKNGFDLIGSGQAFNVLAEYLFGKNNSREMMDMTTPVFTRKVKSRGEKMDMSTPVITKKSSNDDTWVMSFVMPSKYGPNLPLPKDPSVRIKEVPRKLMAVTAFSGLVNDVDTERRERKLCDDLRRDPEFQVKEGAVLEVAQYNPPFTLPFMRRNEIALEVERKMQ